MATLTYVPRDGNPALDRERVENLRLQNEINRTKLERLNGGLIDKREVVFALEYSLTLLRAQILTIPALVSSELREVDTQAQHRVRTRVEDAVHRFLTQLSENMEAAMHGEEFLGKLEAELAGKKDEDAMKLKQGLAKKRRTEKRHEKARKKT